MDPASCPSLVYPLPWRVGLFFVCALGLSVSLAGCEYLGPRVVRGIGHTTSPGDAGLEPDAADVSTPPPASSQAPAQTEDPATAIYRPGSGNYTRVPTPSVIPGGEGGEELTINFEDTNLREVVKVILQDILQENYTIDPAVQGSVTLQTSQSIARESLIPTLEMLLRMNGAALVRKRDFYEVVPREAAVGALVPQLGDSRLAVPSGYGVQVVPLEHVSVVEMQKILEPFALGSNVVRADTNRNLLILAGAGPELARLLETVRIFDVDWLAGVSVALFTPTFVDAKTLGEELQEVFVFDESKGSPLAGLVRFVPLERLNALLVVATRPQYLDQVRDWVDHLDRDTGGVGQRLFVYRVQNGKAADLAAVLTEVFEGDEQTVPQADVAPGLQPVELRSPAQGGGTPEGGGENLAPPPVGAVLQDAQGVAIDQGIGTIRIIADEVNNALLIRGTPGQYKQVEAALNRLDVVPLQVLIEATIAEISLDGDLTYGLEWFLESGNSDGDSTFQLDLGTAGIAAVVPGFSYAFAAAGGDVVAVLNALANESRLNIISSPSLMVLNNQTASIQVGDQVPVTTQQQQSTVGGTSPIVNNIEFRDTGVLLSVTPRVNPGGLVIMEVQQEVSSLAPGTEGGTLTPTISTRNISSTVAVQSGQTIVLGGLISEQKSESRSGIPGLYNLPVIGALFGTTTDDQERTELVVLITPRAVQDAGAAERVTEEFRRKMEALRPLVPPKEESNLIPLVPRVGAGLTE